MYLFVQLTYVNAFQFKVTIHFSFKFPNLPAAKTLQTFLIFCERFLFCLRGSELVFIVFGLLPPEID